MTDSSFSEQLSTLVAASPTSAQPGLIPVDSENAPSTTIGSSLSLENDITNPLLLEPDANTEKEVVQEPKILYDHSEGKEVVNDPYSAYAKYEPKSDVVELADGGIDDGSKPRRRLLFSFLPIWVLASLIILVAVALGVGLGVGLGVKTKKYVIGF
jgi:hypothetical protein